MSSVSRIHSIDFLKCVCIVLMVIFHLAYFSSLHPLAHQAVYVFHIPIFLLISGYLTHTTQALPIRLKKIAWLFVPYAVMELAYVIMASILPIHEHIDGLTVGVVLDKLFLHPIGPYWYLHTLIICYLLVVIADGLTRYIPQWANGVVVLTILGILSWLDILYWVNGAYFLVGFLLSQKQYSLTQVFCPRWWMGILLIVCYALPLWDSSWIGVSKTSLRGILIVYGMISLLMWIYTASKHWKGMAAFLYIGQNTLPILLFSPIFTFACKYLIPFLAWDSTGVLFALLSATIAIGGSLLIAYVMDTLHLSRFFCGKRLLS